MLVAAQAEKVKVNESTAAATEGTASVATATVMTPATAADSAIATSDPTVTPDPHAQARLNSAGDVMLAQQQPPVKKFKAESTVKGGGAKGGNVKGGKQTPKQVPKKKSAKPAKPKLESQQAPETTPSRKSSPKKAYGESDDEHDYVNRCICGFTHNDEHMM